MDLESYILIGGRSSRMGRDKALLEIDGVTFAQRAVDTVREAFPDAKVSLVARDENQFDHTKLPKNVPVIFDIHKDRGAYSGLHAALENAQSEWIFVLACDYPLVTVDLLRFVADLINGVFDAIVTAQPDGRVQPLCAFYRRGIFLPHIEKSLQSDEKLPALINLFEHADTKYVSFDDLKHLPDAERFFLNINSHNELKLLQSLSS